MASVFIPLGVALAWLPLRSTLPNTDVALVLVATIALVALIGGRPAALSASAVAALSFDYLHTLPYETWRVTHGRDVVTTLLIVLVGALVGELTLRLSVHRALEHRGLRDLAVLAGTAELVAVGQDGQLVIGAVCGELTKLLDLSACEFESLPPAGEQPWVERDGSVQAPAVPRPHTAELLELPVWLHGEVVGCFRLTLRAAELPAADRLAIAVSLADQAGAALAADALPPPEPPSRSRLQLVPSGEASGRRILAEERPSPSRYGADDRAMPSAG